MIWQVIGAGILSIGTLVILLRMLSLITASLERIGRGGHSALGKITWGVRAIEMETGHLPTEVTTLNRSLVGLTAALAQVLSRLQATAQAAAEQEVYRP